MKSRILIILLCLLSQIVMSQENVLDTVPRSPLFIDTNPIQSFNTQNSAISKIEQQRLKDSIDIAIITAEIPIKASLKFEKLNEQLKLDPILPFGKKASEVKSQEYIREDKDMFFYIIAGLILYYGFVKISFGKYVSWIFNVFFRSNMRLQQIRDQLQHTPLPSLLLNILFIFVGSVFLLFLSEYFNIATNENDWILLGYYSIIIASIIIAQFLLLKIIGWIFNISNSTDIYIFIIFLVNKIIGIILLPVIVLMAFPIPTLIPVVITIISIVFIILLLYRFIMSYKSIGNEIKVGRFHFFIYLCAFEIAPLLIMGKVLLNYVDSSN